MSIADLVILSIGLDPVRLPFSVGLAVLEVPLSNEALQVVPVWASDRHESKRMKEIKLLQLPQEVGQPGCKLAARTTTFPGSSAR